MDNIHKIHTYLGDKFAAIFKSITSDNGSEFADLAEIENIGNTKVYFIHPYSSFERCTNERHNRLLRCFIPKKSVYLITLSMTLPSSKIG